MTPLLMMLAIGLCAWFVREWRLYRRVRDAGQRLAKLREDYDG